MATITFFLHDKNKQKTSIVAVTSFLGERYKTRTGVSIPTKYWNANRYRCSTVKEFEDGPHKNDILEGWENLLKSVAKEFEVNLVAPSQEDFKDVVEKELRKREGYAEGDKSPFLLDFAIHYKDNCSKSDSTKDNYGTAITHLKAYEKKKRKRVKFNDLNQDFYNSFKNFMLDSTYTLKGEKHYYTKNTIGSIVKNIIVFINESRKDKYHNVIPEGFTVDEEDVDAIYLTVEELIKIHELKINDNLIVEKLDEVISSPHLLKRKIDALNDNKDRFLIGSFTAMRFGDYSGIENIRYADEIITKRTQKTGEKVAIPMHWVIREILKKRNNVLPEAISNQKLNDALKELGRLADLNEMVELTVTRGGRRVTSIHHKWELMTTHTARRNGCTNMYLAGIDIYTIMGFSGHKTEKSFRKYIKVRQEQNAKRFVDHPFFNKEHQYDKEQK